MTAARRVSLYEKPRERAPRGRLTAEGLVPPPHRARRTAKLLAAAFALLGFACLVAPWQQTVAGTGRLIAYAPLDRQQIVEAPIDGRVVRWFTQEGAVVEAGDPLVEVSDNDPQLMDRLMTEHAALSARLASYQAQLEALRRRVDPVVRQREGGVVAAEGRVRSGEQAVSAAEDALEAAEAQLEVTLLNTARQRALVEQGLTSQRDLELTVLAEAQARTGRDRARATVDGARADLISRRAELMRAQAEGDANIESAEISIRTAEAEVAAAQAAITRLDTRIARQQTQLVAAPRHGTVLRLVANQGGEQVKAGDPLLVLVPDRAQTAVELFVDGNDAALITAGRTVRLQFEGWPAVQFTGWPAVAVGSFGGRVAFVDSHDNGRGDFRVVVLPDDDEPWPSPRFLRQGVRANGWVLLEQVTLGFELWRQLNGFPPMLEAPPSSLDRRSSGDKKDEGEEAEKAP